MEIWLDILDFPGYSVSDHGRVRNDHSDRILALRKNQNGVVYVGLSKEGRQHNRPVAILVAEAFIEPPPVYSKYPFNSAIQLDGDRNNLHAHNIVWRPRWFGIAYYKQFEEPATVRIKVPVENVDTGELFENSWVATTRYGLLERRLIVAIHNRDRVFPTNHMYRV